MKSSLQTDIEALLFVAQRPLTFKKLAQLTNRSVDEVRNILNTLADIYSQEERGIVLMIHNDAAEFVSNSARSELIREYTKEEVSGELTRAGLETLTIIAYRGPLTKGEIEHIRGVNCTIVLRNLAMRGLIDTTQDAGDKRYTLSFDCLRHLGISNVRQLPEYESLHADEKLDTILSQSV